MKARPLVTVIVPTKNSSATVEPCLDSIQQQSYDPIQLIVVDNFSSDETPQIAKRFTKHVYQKGPERSVQRNYAVDKAEGEYVCIIDSDMNLEANVIAECVAAMEGDGHISGVVIPEESFGEGFWAQCKKLERSFYLGVPYMEAARFFRRQTFIDQGGYSEAMVSGEDWDLSQRIETTGPLARTAAIIHHNEGRISLLKTVRKKYYYAQKFSMYLASNPHTLKTAQQTSIFSRYHLFFSNPKKLFANPIVGMGMLFMKTTEFFFGGIGMISSRMRKK